MPAARSLEIAAIGSFTNLAAIEIREAQALLDTLGVRTQDFESPVASAVWGIVEAMVREGRTPDLFSVKARLPRAPHDALHEMLVSDERGSAAERLRFVREMGQRRRMAQAAETVRALAMDTSRSLAEVAAEARKVLDGIGTDEATVATLDAEVMAFVDHLEEVALGHRQPVLPTGIEALDAVIGGLQRTLTIVGALPGVGKSGLLAGIVRNLARDGVRVGVFSLEDERQWLVGRLVSEASRIPVFVLNNKPLEEHEKQRLSGCIGRVHNDLRNVVVDDRPAMTAADIVASARRMIVQHGVKAILVDHLGEVRTARSDRHDLEIADVLQQLRALAKTYGVPVLVLCHLKRREGLGPDSEPKLTDFAFSAAVERMARVGLALSKPNDNTLKVHVLKQTSGIAHTAVNLRFLASAGIVANQAAPEVRAAVAKMYGSDDE